MASDDGSARNDGTPEPGSANKIGCGLLGRYPVISILVFAIVGLICGKFNKSTEHVINYVILFNEFCTFIQWQVTVCLFGRLHLEVNRLKLQLCNG